MLSRSSAMSPFDRPLKNFFLLTFHRNYVPILFRFRDWTTTSYLSKVANFCYFPCIFGANAGQDPMTITIAMTRITSIRSL